MAQKKEMVLTRTPKWDKEWEQSDLLEDKEMVSREPTWAKKV